ncbi:interleukin-13 receptor subunit alpha-1-like [Sander lucioperca]|uniref:Interleukin-13 receptor subunit alpha-1-like n=1 Tax=Sander lucioperca TaxID=283035 RepID=A0A8D0D8N4_SANLU|nr:interleukin-13 receptor subunit alpha-1-like [Sander lucioperca]XP_031144282.1 interleukin-13 receptor subunit alpha-1-like [Sander lucioperca]
MFQSLNLLALSSLLLMGKSQQDTILPPQNVSLRWIDDFRPELSWARPQHSMENCNYIVRSETTKKNSEEEQTTSNTSWDAHIVMEGGYLLLSVKIVCEGKSSTESNTKVVKKTNYTELVKDLQCYSRSAEQAHCVWLPGSPAPDLKFYYELPKEDFTVPGKPSFNPTECLKYRYTDGVRTGCDLEANIDQSILILLNGTYNNSLARNTFKKWPSNNMRPPPLNWTVTETVDQFLNVSWTPPDIPVQWTYIINYTECDERKTKEVEKGDTSIRLGLDPRCQYSIAIQAKYKKGEMEGWTPWSHVKYIAAETGPDAWLFAAIIVPVMFAGLAVLLCVCFRKNKEHIFPKVPEPRDLISDIFDNNNKSTVCNLYMPAEEEDNCKITLVEESQINKLG